MTLAVAAFLLAQVPPSTPLEFGYRYLRDHIEGGAPNVELQVRRGGDPESFEINVLQNKDVIAAPDQVGAMYGAFEYAEKVANHRQATPTKQTPYLKDRGLNLFISLPWDYKKNDTDYDPAALTDPDRWWFHNEDYWTTLLDTMAESRLNWLDIHGTYDISVTDFPNLYAYFVTAPSFPNVGVPNEIKQKDLAQLNRVIAMAHARGIRVSLMSYEAKLTIPHNKAPGYEGTEANIYKYTKEAVEQMIKQAPGLDA